MIVLEERLTKKVKHRKPLTLKVIIHQSTVDKIEDEKQLALINKLIEATTDEVAHKWMKLFWDKILIDLPKVKLDGRIKVGNYIPLTYTKIILKVRNPDRLRNQVIELCYEP